ncbi:reverse transcriptase domain-containing protein [Tanacetum coccineum]
MLIVVPAVLADQFELKPELLDFVRAAETWLENEPPCSITTWDDLVSKFLNRFYPHSKTRELRKEIMNFQQDFETYDQNQEAAVQLMQNQMGQMADFQERPLGEFPSNTRMNLPAELKVITSSNGLTLDGSFSSPFNFSFILRNEQVKLETKWKCNSTIVRRHKIKEDPKPNPYQPPIPYPCRLQEENFQALKNLTGRADHDIVDSLCDKLPIENNSLSGSPTLSPDPVVESLSPSLTPSGETDLLLEETDAFLSLDDSIPPGIDNGLYDSEGDIPFLEELLNDEIPRDLPPKELKDDEPSTTKSLIEKLLEIDNEIYDSEGDILFLENLLNG